MTKQLRKRIMIILILLLSSTFLAIIAAINIGLDKGNRDFANDSLQFLIQRESRPDNLPSPFIDDKSKDGEHSDSSFPDNDNSDNASPDNDNSDGTSPDNDNSDGTSPDNDNSDGTSPDNDNSNSTIPNDNELSERKITPPDRHVDIATSHYIIAKYNKNNELQSIDNTLSDSYSDNDIETYCKKILENTKNEGTVDQLRYMKRENMDNIIIAFIDHSSAVESGKNLRLISVIGSILAIALFVLISYFLSGWLVKPVNEAFNKQKQFISDASHELKTPITVILSNSELLEDQIGDNKQLSYIKDECDRMKNLVTSLLTLTRLEQTPYKDVAKNDFCISDTVLERLMPMESVAFEKGITMDYDNVTPDLHFFGVKEQIGQVTAILLDNAITHTDQGGKITVSLWNTPHYTHLTVANTGKEIPPEDREKLFERFYRADESRHRASGHFGLGLSIAKTIVTNHKGKIWVNCENGITTFSVKLQDTNKQKA